MQFEIKYLLLIYGCINFFLIFYSYFRLRRNKQSPELIWWGGVFNGSFVWEDMFIFSILHTNFVFISLFTDNTKLWIIFILIFWIVRSFGEIMYFFFQQFFSSKKNPHNIHDQLGFLHKIFGNIDDQKLFIIMQVFYQSVMVGCIVGLIFVLREF